MKNSYSFVSPTVVFVHLTQGKVTSIDADDLELVGQYRWCAWFNSTSRRWYARTEVAGKAIYLHRLLLDAKKGNDVDHANGDSLDNRRENLREASRSQNQANRGATKRNSTGFKGVTRVRSGKYTAVITANGVTTRLGTFADKAEAARAYDAAALESFGPFAFTNFPVTQAVA